MNLSPSHSVARIGLTLALTLHVSALSGCGTTTPDPAADSGGSQADSNIGDSAGSDAAADGAATDATGTADAGTTKADTGSSIKCHPVNNTGCPAGQHCVWEANSIVCTADGEHAAGADCTDGKGCKIGVCVGVQGSSKSVCSPHCLANLECASSICNSLQDSKGKVCDMGVQVTQCDPFGTGCEVGKTCYAGGNGFVCMSVGDVEAGKVCADDNSCAAGLACVGKSGSGAGVCRKMCKMGGGAPSCDDISVTCASLLGSSTAGYCGG